LTGPASYFFISDMSYNTEEAVHCGCVIDRRF